MQFPSTGAQRRAPSPTCWRPRRSSSAPPRWWSPCRRGLGLLRRPVDRAPQELPLPGRGELVRVGQVGLITAAGVALVTPLGMIPALTVMLLALVRRMGGSWLGAAGTALFVPAALHLLFVRWLGVPLPRGPVGL